jgi:tetratricopeptide (TPR) repeat protein
MRTILSGVVLACLLAGSPALHAQEGPPDLAPDPETEQQPLPEEALPADPPAEAAPAPQAAAPDAPDRLDTLFTDLKRARSEAAAQRIARSIWDEWFKSGSATVDLMMTWSDTALKAKKFDVALDFLDQVIVLRPDYAEGWNRRATVHFMMDNYSKSMVDIDRTLQLEPRHFGALSGLATIMYNTGRKEMALEAYERVLDVYPMMRNAQEQLGKLAEELTGEGI